jgi:hypothetical protein
MSSSATGVALLLVAGSLLLVPLRPRIVASTDRPRRSGARRGPAWRGGLWATAVAAAGLTLFPGLWWSVLPAAAVVAVVVARRPAGQSSAIRGRERRLIAVHAELFAACLDAGMATGTALLAVSDVLAAAGPVQRPTPGPSPPSPPRRSGGGEIDRTAGPLAGLDAVAAMLSLGADPATAWRAVDLDGVLAAAALRSAAGGSGLAEAVREYAAQLRQDIAAESMRAAGRAGVLMTAPLGLCFLPAFLCLGLAPVVVGLLGQLQIF